ncbi:hypothetical protein BSKO_04874 [Bryopsis sp. KO-2023]|nr:hypothetical protein BSKO_04874 [Bryopsis sp. KO-2023]
MSVEIGRKASAPLEELEALAYDATEKLTYQDVEASRPSLSLKQHSAIPVATKTPFLAEGDDKEPKRYSSLINEIWGGSSSDLPSDVRRLSVGSSRHLHAPRISTQPERRRGSHMQFSPSHEGRWGWETRLREAEADLSAVKAKRASFSSRPTEGSHVHRIPNVRRAASLAHTRFDKPGSYPGKEDHYENTTIERAKSSRLSSLAPSDDQHAYDDFGHHKHGADVRIPADAKGSGLRGPPDKSIGTGGLAKRRNTTGGAPFAFQQRSGSEIRRTGSDGAALGGQQSGSFWGDDKDGAVELNEDHGSFREGEQRMPGVGDRWACQVLMEELTNMKAELQRAKEREGSLERQLRTVIVERDSIQRLWENEHSKVSDMKRSMQSALSDASNKLRARLSRTKQLQPHNIT